MSTTIRGEDPLRNLQAGFSNLGDMPEGLPVALVGYVDLYDEEETMYLHDRARIDPSLPRFDDLAEGIRRTRPDYVSIADPGGRKTTLDAEETALALGCGVIAQKLRLDSMEDVDRLAAMNAVARRPFYVGEFIIRQLAVAKDDRSAIAFEARRPGGIAMRYLMMKPEEIRDAVARDVPLLIASGAVEYHGPHLPIGTDVLIPESIIQRIEARCECIVFPSLPFSPTMFWAAGPEDGEFDFDPDALSAYAEEIFRGLLRIGFRRIYVMQHHQGSHGLPQLILKRAAAKLVRETAKAWSPEWGRGPHAEIAEPRIFGMIRIANIDAFSKYRSDDEERIPIGHAGKGETQLMMGGYPGCADLERLSELMAGGPFPEWLDDAFEASESEGDRWLDFCAQGWIEELTRGGGR